MMKFKHLATSLLVAVGLLMPLALDVAPAAAINVVPNCGINSQGGTPAVCGDLSSGNGGNNPIITVIKVAIDILSFVVGVAAIIGIVVNGLRMITANGDPGSIASARTGIIYSLVGVVVVIVGQTIVVFVLDKLKGNGV